MDGYKMILKYDLQKLKNEYEQAVKNLKDKDKLLEIDKEFSKRLEYIEKDFKKYESKKRFQDELTRKNMMIIKWLKDTKITFRRAVASS